MYCYFESMSDACRTNYQYFQKSVHHIWLHFKRFIDCASVDFTVANLKCRIWFAHLLVLFWIFKGEKLSPIRNGFSKRQYGCWLIALRVHLWFDYGFCGIFWFAHATTFDENIILAGERNWPQWNHQKQIRNISLRAFTTDNITFRGSVWKRTKKKNKKKEKTIEK